MFAGGLGSFVSDTTASGEDKEEEQEDATAGMEITVHGVTIRPFVFFTGQGELMGHVWSGTGSDKTPAYQVIIDTHFGCLINHNFISMAKFVLWYD